MYLNISQPLASLYGLELTPDGTFIERLLGAELIGDGFLASLLRNAAPSPNQHVVLLAFFITDSLGFIVVLIAQLSGLMNFLGWSIVAIYLLLATGFGNLRFVKNSTAQSTSGLTRLRFWKKQQSSLPQFPG